MGYLIEVVDLQTLPPAQTVLSQREQAFYQTLKLPKRQTEWFGGRLALKKLLAAYTGKALPDFTLLAKDRIGKPIITVGEKEFHIPFSLTHSNGYAVAAIAPDVKYIGIDLEKIAPRINAWKRDFFHSSELTQEGDGFLTSLWTQKEALVKLLGSGLTVNSFEVRIVEGTPVFLGRALEIYTALGSPHITLQTRLLIPGFAFSVAVGK